MSLSDRYELNIVKRIFYLRCQFEMPFKSKTQSIIIYKMVHFTKYGMASREATKSLFIKLILQRKQLIFANLSYE